MQYHMVVKQDKLLLGIVVLFWFAQYVYIPFQTPYLLAGGVSANLVGIIIGAYGISQLLLRLPVGIMADTVGTHKIFIISGGILAGAASVLRLIMPVHFGFLIGNLLSGLGSAMWISFMVFFTEYVSKDSKEKATGRLVFCNNLGMLCGFLTSTLCYEKMGMPFLCGLSVMAGFIAAVMGSFLKDSKRKIYPVKIKSLLMVCLNRRLFIFAVLALVQQGIQVSTTMSYTTQVLKNLGASAAFIGGSSIFYMLSAVGFAYAAASKAFMKIGTKRFIPILFLLLGVYCLGVPRMTTPWGVLMLQVLPGMATGLLFTYVVDEAMKEIPAEKKSTAMGFFQAFYAIGMTCLPILTGFLAVKAEMKTAFDSLGIIATGAMVVSILASGKGITGGLK